MKKDRRKKEMAKLYFRYGAMNCGKSTLLLQTAYNYEEQGMKVALLKPAIDTKGDDQIVSRALSSTRTVDYKITDRDDVYQLVKKKFSSYHCILVDEAQFLKKDQVDALMKIVTNLNIPVICYGLRVDFLTNGFEGSTRLLQIAHTIEEMKTICKCGRKATFVIRKVNGVPVFQGEQVAIDGEEKVTYESVCPNCYQELKCQILSKETSFIEA